MTERRLHRRALYLRPAERLSRSAHVFKELHEGPHIESRRVGLHEAPYRRQTECDGGARLTVDAFMLKEHST